MKILYVERSLRTESLVFDQIQRISQKNVITQILALQESGVPPLKFQNVTSVSVPFFPKIESIKGWLFTRSALKEYSKLVSKHSFDLIHAHFVYPQGLVARAISLRYHLPYVLTGRGDDILIYPYKNNYLYRSISKTLRECHGFIAVSRHIQKEATQLGIPSDRCIVQPNGIPIEIFNAENLKQYSRIPNRVLFVGSFVPVKNVIALLRAVKILTTKRPEVHLHLTGSGPLENDIRKEIKHLQIEDSCEILGQLPHVELAPVMKKTSVLVLPSYSEGWPNVIMEAMACGTPVVASNVGGIPEQIENDSIGLLCDPRFPEDIAAKILIALDKDWDHVKIAKHGSKYNRTDTATKIIQFYKKVINNQLG